MVKKDSDRIAYIDIARAFAIFLVVLGHTLTKGKMRRVIYSFHIPLFFLISGMVLKEKNPYKIKDFFAIIKKRAISYYIPYIIWGLFYSTLSLSNFLKLLWGSRKMLIEIKSLSSLWFLPVLLIASILSEYVMWIQANKKNNLFVFASLLLFLATGFHMSRLKSYGWPLGLDIGFVAAGFMLTGYFLKKMISKLYITTIGCVLMTVVLSLVFTANIIFKYVPIKAVDMYKGKYGNVMMFTVNALLGSIVVISIAICFDRLFPKMSLLRYIGKNTLGIMVLHKPIVRLISSIAVANGYSNNTIWVAFIITLIGGVLSLIITDIIRRLAPPLLGRN